MCPPGEIWFIIDQFYFLLSTIVVMILTIIVVIIIVVIITIIVLNKYLFYVSEPNVDVSTWSCYFQCKNFFTHVFPCFVDPGSWVDGIPVQQQSKWHPGWWNGTWQNHPNHCTHYLPDGVQEAQRPLSHHCSSLVSTPELSSYHHS